MNLFSSTLYRMMEWISRFAYLNLLWILFSLLGLVVFGLFPATIAVFAIMRDWLRGSTDSPVFQSFWKYVKADFVKSNLMGLFVVAIVLLIRIDLYFIQMNIDENVTWMNIPLFAFIVLFLLFLFYLFPSFVHFDLNIFKLIKNAFLIMLISPIHSFLIILSIGSIFFLFKLIPALAFIFGSSIYAFITTWLCLDAFRRIQIKQSNAS
ncbi:MULTISPECIES: DUF624 domain-containing protein [unclassified Virgibacillus]|uniref:YesL family protein n=1 Tax=unclassified Virgibacillus TaxID=2620237 RepID=UPI0024DE9E70|nr:DUF624 domain-containing protein [Virgibacillus sp. LDC-1]